MNLGPYMSYDNYFYGKKTYLSKAKKRISLSYSNK